MQNLTELHLEACENLASLEGTPASLTGYAAFTYCPKLETLDGLQAANGLERLDLAGCTGLKNIAAIAELTRLREVNLGDCRLVTDISAVTGLPEIQIVQLGGSGVPATKLSELQKALPDVIFDFTGGGEF